MGEEKEEAVNMIGGGGALCTYAIVVRSIPYMETCTHPSMPVLVDHEEIMNYLPSMYC